MCVYARTTNAKLDILAFKDLKRSLTEGLSERPRIRLYGMKD